MKEVNRETLIDAIEYIEQKKAIFGELAMSTEFSLAAYKMLLATMEAEPVIVVGDDGGDALSYRRLIQSFAPGTKLYLHAEPAPPCSTRNN